MRNTYLVTEKRHGFIAGIPAGHGRNAELKGPGQSSRRIHVRLCSRRIFPEPGPGFVAEVREFALKTVVVIVFYLKFC